MSVPRLKNLATSTVLAAAGAVLLAGGPVHAAAPGASPNAAVDVRVLARAGVQAMGAGAVVTIETKCPAGSSGYLYTQVTQSQPDGDLVNGETFQSVECTGEPTKVEVGMAPVPSSEDGAIPFQAGPLFVSANLDVCDEFECKGDQDSSTVSLRDTDMSRPRYEDPMLTLALPRRADFEANGAGVVVTVRYTCAAGVSGYFEAQLGQLTSPGVVSTSFDFLGLTCTAQKRSGVLAFHAYTSAWVPGPAFLALRGDACGPASCVSPAAFRTVTVA